MAFGFSKSTVSPIAIDFGFDSLKVLQIHLTDPPQMVAAGTVSVPEDSRRDGSARHAFMSDALGNLLKQLPLNGRRAICSLPAYQTLVQNLQINKSDDEAVEAQVAQHLRERLNMDPSRMVVRAFQEVEGGQSSGQNLVCVAASRQVVMRHIETAERAKLDVVGMHCEPLAILRAFAYLYRRSGDEDRNTCFIDIGAATTKVVIAHGAKVAFAKTIHTAADHLTKHYAQAHGLTIDEARRKRIEEGGTPVRQQAVTVHPSGQGAAAVQNDDTAVTLQSPSVRRSGVAVLDENVSSSGDDRRGRDRPSGQQPLPTEGDGVVHTPLEGADALDCLIDELRLCIRYHQSVYPQRPVEKLVFLGGEARQVSTCQHVARSIRIGAQLGDPLARIVCGDGGAPEGVNLREPQPGWAVPVGLCQCEPNL